MVTTSKIVRKMVKLLKHWYTRMEIWHIDWNYENSQRKFDIWHCTWRYLSFGANIYLSLSLYIYIYIPSAQYFYSSLHQLICYANSIFYIAFHIKKNNSLENMYLLTIYHKILQKIFFLQTMIFGPNLLRTIRNKQHKSNDSICIISKLATIVEGDPKAPFSIATTPRCRGGRYSIPRIAPLYPWTVPYNAEC